MNKKLTVDDVIDRLQAKIDRMEAKIEKESLEADANEFLPMIDAYQDAINLLGKVGA